MFICLFVFLFIYPLAHSFIRFFFPSLLRFSFFVFVRNKIHQSKNILQNQSSQEYSAKNLFQNFPHGDIENDRQLPTHIQMHTYANTNTSINTNLNTNASYTASQNLSKWGCDISHPSEKSSSGMGECNTKYLDFREQIIDPQGIIFDDYLTANIESVALNVNIDQSLLKFKINKCANIVIER